MYDDNFSADNIEQLPDTSSREDVRLLSKLQAVYQPLAESHARSLARVRVRLAQQEALGHVSLPPQWTQSERKILTIKGKNAMEDKNVAWGMNSSMPLPQAKKRGSMGRMLGISLLAAVAAIVILSFTVFSSVLRSVPPTAGNRSSTSTGARGVQQAISNGKLVCSVGLDIRSDPPAGYTITRVRWSAQGKIAALSSQNLAIFSAKDCSAKSALSTTAYNEDWSPDGTKLVTASLSTKTLDVLDSHSNVITKISFTRLDATSVGSLTWSPDGKKLVFVSIASNHQNSIKSVDVANGDVKTLMTVPTVDAGVILLSPGGKYALLVQPNSSTRLKDHSIWDVNAGKKLSDLPSDDGKGGFSTAAFSPDGSLFAQGGNGKIEIYRTADGALQSSFEANNGGRGMDNLAWSPDGKYLAGGATSINIYDVNAGKILTTFGKVDAHHEIFSLAWAPDDTGLVSSTNLVPDDGHSQTLVNVWALS